MIRILIMNVYEFMVLLDGIQEDNEKKKYVKWFRVGENIVDFFQLREVFRDL